jgi:hypothetical protein
LKKLKKKERTIMSILQSLDNLDPYIIISNLESSTY